MFAVRPRSSDGGDHERHETTVSRAQDRSGNVRAIGMREDEARDGGIVEDVQGEEGDEDV